MKCPRDENHTTFVDPISKYWQCRDCDWSEDDPEWIEDLQNQRSKPL